MSFDAMIERFAKDAPVATMVRGLLANVLSPKQLDTIFRETACRQREDALLFSTVVGLLSLAVTKTHKSLHAAYQANLDQVKVAVKSLYNKVNGVEPEVSRELVRRTAEPMREIMAALGGKLLPGLGGCETRILDGSHLAATEHRLKELRTVRGGPLPGQALVVLDPRRNLIEDILPCEDGHAQERSLLLEFVELLKPNQLWIADRNFCTLLMLFEIALNKAFFIIREHAGLTVHLKGKRGHVGTTATCEVYEQIAWVEDVEGDRLEVRRITIYLNEPTEDGTCVIVVLTNLPSRIKSTAVADEYHRRWTIEKVFGELTLSLRGEIDTLAYPRAALLCYAIALLTYNVLSVVKAALQVVHGVDVHKQVSTYYLADEVSGMWRGMEVAVPAAQWRKTFASLEPPAMARKLKSMAAHADLRRYQKHPRGPKKKRPPRRGSEPHVSTARILTERLKC